MKKILNYKPSSISFGDGFNGPRGDVGYMMRMDLVKAKKIFNMLDKKHMIECTVGLDGDWDVNSEQYLGGDNVDIWTTSIWATPIMIVDYDDRPSETYEIWKRD